MDLQVKDQVAVVAAASKGLGKAAAMALAEEGARVAICARSDALDETAEQIREKTGAEVLAVRTDLRERDQVDAFVKQALDRYGHIDILIVNCGGPPPGNFMDLTIEDWEAGVQTTIMSALYLSYAVIPHMLERGSGSIVSTVSYSVKQPLARLITSNSLRLAVVGLMKSLANELGPQGIRVNSINPAWTWTDRIEQLMSDRAEAAGTTIEEESAKAAASLPLGRMGTLDEYGKTIAWLASPAASFVHGHALMFDGGGVSAPL
ncbi:MAG: SDR family oxidoreductase [Chloroflexi bacterium]|nr:SDR family oxidoreductase [Chloroflexota bacterium]MCH8875408.1 SDR family oxidoreductase [Chloroflexota bacterium]